MSDKQKQTRKTSKQRYLEVVDAALVAARKHGYRKIRRQDIADELGVTPALVTHYLGPLEGLKDLLVCVAIDREDLVILGQAVIARHPVALGAPKKLRLQALQHYVEENDNE